MAAVNSQLLSRVLEACARAAPQPLYPSTFAQEVSLDRAALDQALDELRVRGLVQLTDWVPGRGQGYLPTPAGLDALRRGIDPRRQQPAPAPVTTPDDDYQEEHVRDAVLRPTRPVVTWTMIAVNVFIFFVGMLRAEQGFGVSVPDYLSASGPGVSRVLFEMGALIPEAVWQLGDWWRLLTYAFLHIGILHVLANMYFLFIFGPILETMWGSARYLLLYLAAALTGGCLVLWADRGALTAGASGALSGLAASMAVWLYLNREALPAQVHAALTRTIIFNLILLAVISTFSGISWEGHLGGALGGAIVSLPLQASRFSSSRGIRLLGWLGALLVPVLFFVVVVGRAWMSR